MKIPTSYLKKFSFRFLIVVIVFFMVKLTMDPDRKPFDINYISIFYFLSAFFLFMFTWETNDWLIRKKVKNHNNELNTNSALTILGLNMLLLAPVSAITYYLALFIFDFHCLGEDPDLWLQFRIDFFRAILLGFAVIVFNLLYFFLNQKKEQDRKIDQLKKELTTAQYQSLKDQISPHFLFNSLNTLTSLMYEDRDLAADYVNRLASSYRYILDNREHDIISLDKELSFLDSFVFTMVIRHPKSLVININIDKKLHYRKIPTLCLQMLLENALKHNIYSPISPLVIDIFSEDENSITIKNNLQIRPQLEESTGLGIVNIKKRYAFYTKDDVIVNQNDLFYAITIPLIS